MKQKLSLTQLSKVQMEDVSGGDTVDFDSAIAMCDCEGNSRIHVGNDSSQNYCECTSPFIFYSIYAIAI